MDERLEEIRATVSRDTVLGPAKAAELLAEVDRLRAMVAAALTRAEDGDTDGGHHKQWVIDQMVRILTDCPTVQREARDYKGVPYTYDALGESDAYHAWLRDFADGEDGPHTYSWDVGIPP